MTQVQVSLVIPVTLLSLMFQVRYPSDESVHVKLSKPPLVCSIIYNQENNLNCQIVFCFIILQLICQDACLCLSYSKAKIFIQLMHKICLE